jgi:hypothetical protein
VPARAGAKRVTKPVSARAYPPPRGQLLINQSLFILAGGVAALAVVDHWHKGSRMGPASVASWYCKHRGQRCQEPQSANIEEAWQHRELVYRVTFWSLTLGGLTALALRLRLTKPKKSRQL